MIAVPIQVGYSAILYSNPGKIICCNDESSELFLFEGDKPLDFGGHDGDGRGRKNSCWWVTAEDVIVTFIPQIKRTTL